MTETTNNQQRTVFKTNPNKANLKRNDGFSAYYTRDCHGTHRINRAVEGRGKSLFERKMVLTARQY
ncbi:MAG: hypothetical protein ACYS9C_09235 [Planctomycetota bacterium]|jgi:hypothetical protein